MPLAFVGDITPQHPLCLPRALDGHVVVANLECAIGDGAARAGKAHCLLLAEDAYQRIHHSGVAAFSLANNHVYDAGPRAFDRMAGRLRDLPNVQFFGFRERPFAELTVDGVRCAVIGCLERCRSRGRRLVREEDVAQIIREVRPRVDRVFVTPHWGKEGEFAHHPSPQQRRRAAQWIDAGASGVFGHHPHTFHGCESLEGRPVYYSLGNCQCDNEEGRDYPLSAYGLAACGRLEKEDAADDVWETVYLDQTGGGVTEAGPQLAGPLTQLCAAISRDLCNPRRRWTWTRWARHVGPVYWQKCRKSWNLRFRRDPLRTLPWWLLWCALPKTLLLRWGAGHGEAGFLARVEDLARKLRRTDSLVSLRCRRNTASICRPGD